MNRRYKRYIQIGEFVSSVPGFTLCGWSLSPPVFRSVREGIPGMDGDVDCSELLTGRVQYNNRTLTATLELSEKNRMYRKTVIDKMMNELDGKNLHIILPDDPHLYLNGRVQIAPQYNDAAHAAVKITAVCDPWRYAKQETLFIIENTAGPQNTTVRNQGRRAVCPFFTVSNSCNITVGTVTHEITDAGTYQYDDIIFSHGNTVVRHSGNGTLQIRFREGWL